ncbi:sugar ABC transporter permease [Sporanaerobium hydrogeniformans]|uniref:Sugar ABC transporter permease n=1 Tax=Sporanaerobium hydrogeniformans TaxID=3072179 RepID=A0AC61DCC3_9FIRM|nr:sugar ABC transporter permease [Sporanaerobium hydrogeniformans]PHV70959.1 sugar ABC transporter permease [Sporanaerobium hydrogeniformans]
MKKTRKASFSKDRYIGLLYIAPWLIGFLVFTLYPIVASFYLSFTEYDLLSAPTWVGLQNFKELFKDKEFIKALTVTAKYVIFEVPLKLAFSLFIAFILNMNLKGINFFRTAYYIPSILGSNVAIAILWKFIFSTDGLVNQVLGVLHMNPISWFGQANPAMFTIILLRVWEFGSTMVIFLAALKEVPGELYEAAEVDGSSKLRNFFTITLPMITPVLFFNFVMQLVHAFQEFNAPYLVTNGGPMKGTYLLPMLIYDNTFKYYNMGYASAMSWILFIIIMAFTMITFRSSKYWVFYNDNGGEE